MASLQDERVNFKPASAGRLRDDFVYDPDVDWSELYSISRINIEGENATVSVDFYKYDLGGASYEHHFKRKDGAWEFVGSKLRRIS